jgi:prolyl-tRNA synthetase
VAPADVHLVAAGRDAVVDHADRLAAALGAAGVRVLYDDRERVSPGVKFADAELIGVPTIVVVGRKLAEGTIEVRDRVTGERHDVPVADAVAHLAALAGAT